MFPTLINIAPSSIRPVPNPSEIEIATISAVDGKKASDSRACVIYIVTESVVNEFSDQIDVCVQHYHKEKPQGMIFIVIMHGAPGTNKDLQKVQSTFEHPDINFAILPTQSPTSARLSALIVAASKYEYPLNYKFIAFYFSGHGGTDKDKNAFVKTLDQKVFIEQSIIEPLKSIERIRLFFFDCCRNQPTTGAKNVDAARSGDTSSAPPIVKRACPEGEVIAYAVSIGQKAYGDRIKGSGWTRCLCDNIMVPDPIVTVLAKTNDDMQKLGHQKPTTKHNVGNKVIISSKL